MNQSQEYSNWKDVLDKCFKDLDTIYPDKTEVQLSETVNIPRTTLNRLKGGKTRPQLSNYIRLIIGSGNSELLSEALSFMQSDLGDAVKDAMSVALGEENKLFSDNHLENLFDDRDVFVAYLLANTSSGTTLKQVAEVLGDKGLDCINLLVKKGLVQKVNSKYLVLRTKSILVRTFESIKRHISTYAQFYRPSHVGKERNYVHSLSEGLNEVGIKKVQAAHRRFHAEIQEILRKPENQGDIPSFSVSFCDTFTKLNDSEEKEDMQ